MPSGRLTKYTPEIADKICQGIASGRSLRKICAEEGMPSVPTVCEWVLDDREGFSEQYTKARRIQAETLADEIFDIADDGSQDSITRHSDTGDYEVPNTEYMQRSRLRVDTRKWYLSKVLPKVYGDKQQLEHSGPDGKPVEVVTKVELIPLTK
jgi:hypothetical protein